MTTTAQDAVRHSEEIAALSVNAVPEDGNMPLTLDTATPEEAQEIRARMDGIDLGDTQSIVRFGAGAQAGLQEISARMLDDVRNKEVGPAGDSLRDMVTTIRGFSVSELDVRRERTWWDRLTGRTTPFATFLARYERVQHQIDSISDRLLKHEHTLLKDIKALDVLYDRTLDFYRELALFIAAGEAKLAELDRETIPARESALTDLPESERMVGAQALRDLRAARDDLDRRVHDLRLTRQVTMQSLPAIRLVQENDKSLVTKINSVLVNTVPLWETQLAQAVAIQRGREAAASVKEAQDLTNELLTSNAQTLQQANREIRTQTERGVFDVEAVREANGILITTIGESLQIAEEAKTRRAAAEDSLRRMEADLREALAAAKAKKRS
ncbi:toxic anion resistance protein [Falsirhodobacter deserti]|uniref:toxic anion resistance protein n=1 Tax=Falsirhodobacter deserti TaxID=1365611 RepID=UPI000FE3E389|nr:toxic anion resistance protein [Falsirhodobacter deserti]